jgi:hypothetical protein
MNHDDDISWPAASEENIYVEKKGEGLKYIE